MGNGAMKFAKNKSAERQPLCQQQDGESNSQVTLDLTGLANKRASKAFLDNLSQRTHAVLQEPQIDKKIAALKALDLHLSYYRDITPTDDIPKLIQETIPSLVSFIQKAKRKIYCCGCIPRYRDFDTLNDKYYYLLTSQHDVMESYLRVIFDMLFDEKRKSKTSSPRHVAYLSGFIPQPGLQRGVSYHRPSF